MKTVERSLQIKLLHIVHLLAKCRTVEVEATRYIDFVCLARGEAVLASRMQRGVSGVIVTADS